MKNGFLNRLRFFSPEDPSRGCREEVGPGNWTQTRCGEREWETLYRRRWQYDKKVRSTHDVNCTGSCSWDVYVKDGILVWETQATDYPACGEGYPNHEPRGCPRGAAYSWHPRRFGANRPTCPKAPTGNSSRPSRIGAGWPWG